LAVCVVATTGIFPIVLCLSLCAVLVLFMVNLV
jgi:hypothetical protein